MGARALGSGPGQRVHWAWGLQNLGALARIPWRRSGVRVPALPLGRCVSLGKPRALSVSSCITETTIIIVAADRCRRCASGLLLTLFLRGAGGKPGALSPFHSQEHQGAEMF